MGTGFRAAGAVTSVAAQVTSLGLSLSGTLAIGDVVYLCISSSSSSATQRTYSASGGGVTTWTAVGTQPSRTGSGANSYVGAQLFLGTVTTAGGGTVTCTCSSSEYMAAAYEALDGTAVTPTDVYPTPLTYGATKVTSFATPSGTTGPAGDWYLTFLAGNFSTAGAGTFTAPSGCATQASSNGSDGQLTAVGDNETALGASASFGGGSWGYSKASIGITFSVAVSAGVITVSDAAAAADQVTAQVTGIPVVLITAPPRPAGPAPPPVPAQILTVPQGNAVPADAAGAAETMTAGTVTVPLADSAGAADTISGGVFAFEQAAAAEAMTVTAVTAALGEVAAASDLNTAAVQAVTSDYAASTDINQTTGLTQSDAAAAADALTAHVTLSLTDKAAAAEGYGTEPAIGASGGATRPVASPGTSQVAVAAPGGSRWYYLGSLGQVTALTYSFVCPGGADTMSCTVMVPASFRTQLFDPGWQVRITRGGHQVWSGKLDEPVPTSSGWNLTAVGDGNRGADFLAVYSDTWPTNQPDESINGAVSRGLPWVNPGVGQPAGAWFGQAVDSGAQTITALLNLVCTRGAMTWMVNSQPGGYPGNDLSVFPLPTVPNRLLVSTTPVARTLAADINTIYLRYQVSAASTGSGGSGAATYGLTSAQNAASVAMHGELETYIDLSNAGTMSAGAAQAVGNNVLAIYQRASFAGPFVGNYGALMNMGGAPVDPGTDQAGTVCRLILTDFGYGGEVVPGPVQFITGRYEWNDFTQQFSASPYQSVDLSLTGLLSLQNTVLAPVAVPSGITGG